MKRHDDEVEVGAGLVRRLLRAQFPAWADLPLRIVEPSGTDHTIFRLGDELTVRLPVVAYATGQAEREARWVPFLAPQVPLALPEPVARGEPGEGYPFPWSVVRWIDGERATAANLDPEAAAVDLAAFLRALRACDPTGGPPAGEATGWRGRGLQRWQAPLEPWIARLDGHPLLPGALAALREAMDAPPWAGDAAWFHGDLAWNLVARDGRLVGAIDSGYGVGDPACDLVPGWVLLRGAARRRFFDESGLDAAAVARARGWPVAPALIGLSYYADVPHLAENARRSIEGAVA